MGLLGKGISILLCTILPEKWSKAILDRITRTKRAMTSNLELRIFWRVLFFPIVLPLSLLMSVCKTILIWLFPTKVYNDARYLFQQFYTDIVSRKLNVKLAWKRVQLCHELFTKGAEKRVSYGEKNPDITFYVLRPYYYLTRNELTQNISNLMFHYYRNLQHLAYGIEHGWVPVVDWENYGPFAHEEEYPIHGTKNCWEYFWNQPSPYTLKEVYESKNVILCVQNTRDNEYIPSCSFKEPLQKQAEEYALQCPKYDQRITLNKYTEQYVKQKQDLIFPSNARILGVSVRGTSYGLSNTKTAADGHPRQPSLTKLIKSIHKVMDEWDMQYVYIACELQEVIDEIKAEFGSKAIFLPRLRYIKTPQRGDVEKGKDPLYVPGQKYQTNLDYLTEMVLLSRCTSLLAAMSSGVRAAIIWNNNQYENMKILENGLW